MTAHTPVQAVLELQAEHGFAGHDVDHVTVAGTERMATVNNIQDPTDIMMAQYSIPFCVALALFRDPRDPASFDDAVIEDPDISIHVPSRGMKIAEPPLTVAGASVVTISAEGWPIVRRVGWRSSMERRRDRWIGRAARQIRDLDACTPRADALTLFDRLQDLEDGEGARPGWAHDRIGNQMVLGPDIRHGDQSNFS